MSTIGKSIPAELESSAPGLIRHRLQAAKVPLCLLVGFSALFGFALASGTIGPSGLVTAVAVFLLACGGASMNSFQEYRCDRLMRRTAQRPVARGLLAPEQARMQGQVLIGGGLLALLLGSASTGPVIGGIVAVILYNGVYTPLKYRSVWALLPGAACGAIPPYIGWLAGGGMVLSPVALGIVLLLVLWQMPHVWLVMLDNERDYRTSAMPNLVAMMTERSLRVVSISWIIALIAVLHVLIVMLADQPAGFRLSASIASLAVGVWFCAQMGWSRRPDYRSLFILLNALMLTTMALLTAGSLVAGG